MEQDQSQISCQFHRHIYLYRCKSDHIKTCYHCAYICIYHLNILVFTVHSFEQHSALKNMLFLVVKCLKICVFICKVFILVIESSPESYRAVNRLAQGKQHELIKPLQPISNKLQTKFYCRLTNIHKHCSHLLGNTMPSDSIKFTVVCIYLHLKYFI